ncbi:AAA family ATPase [Flavobacterium sp. MFBS3-15]|uniref:AAA family ATPase n=1 Tax=Flavobacterium sp. MFBS3-15 TaxID=2989816 RepID=UPI002235D5D8|nr:AAA family ATPase [Flavobacterium sp. MFBS3-15]MCW4468512.1 AAA family ATPase [Flavobacterium sp. MFBS3-15]
MEQIKHIKNISIENFKCFDKFSVERFGKYNIILGDNNVGKSSFLESLLFENNISKTIRNFQGLLLFKNIVLDKAYFENPFRFFLNTFSAKKTINVSLEYRNGNGFNLVLEPVFRKDLDKVEQQKLSDDIKFLNIEEVLKARTNNSAFQYRLFDTRQNFEGTDDYIPYVYSTANYSSDLVRFFTANFSISKESKNSLISSLKFLVPNISNVEITLNYIDQTPIIGLWLDDKDSLLPLPMFGDGTIRLFRIIMEIAMSNGKHLCVDEIDTGFHYSRYKEVVKILLSVASFNKVQLFISTHNNEFLKSFKEVLEENDFIDFQNETKSFTLKKLPNGDIKAYRYDFEEFEFAIEQENELR